MPWPARYDNKLLLPALRGPRCIVDRPMANGSTVETKNRCTLQTSRDEKAELKMRYTELSDEQLVGLLASGISPLPPQQLLESATACSSTRTQVTPGSQGSPMCLFLPSRLDGCGLDKRTGPSAANHLLTVSREWQEDTPCWNRRVWRTNRLQPRTIIVMLCRLPSRPQSTQ